MPAGHWEFEVIGSEGILRARDNGIGFTLRKARKAGKRTYMEDVPPPEYEKKSATVNVLEDLVLAQQQGRRPLGDIEIAHHATELCFAVADSHRRGGERVAPPVEDRDMYIFHV